MKQRIVVRRISAGTRVIKMIAQPLKKKLKRLDVLAIVHPRFRAAWATIQRVPDNYLCTKRVL